MAAESAKCEETSITITVSQDFRAPKPPPVDKSRSKFIEYNPPETVDDYAPDDRVLRIPFRVHELKVERQACDFNKEIYRCLLHN